MAESENKISWIKDIELLRAYIRAIIVFIFMMGLWHVMTNYISPGVTDIMNTIKGMEHLTTAERAISFKLLEKAIASSIPAATVWSWFTGVVTGTLIIYYFGEKVSGK